jgi:hypothetical protein
VKAIKRELDPDSVREWSDEHLRHCLQNSKALSRRRRLSARMQASLAQALPVMQSEADDRGLTVGWRSYPLTLEFGARAALTGDGTEVEHLAPPEARDLKRAKQSDDPPAVPAAELLALLERSVAEHVDGHAEP